jgi:predicted Zn-ribbon and HTH transcriptional regulator
MKEFGKVMILGNRCSHCGYEWKEKNGVASKVCPNPKCHTPYWDRPKRNK